MGQGNVFTSVCHSVDDGGGVASQHALQDLHPGGLPPGEFCIQGVGQNP